MSFNPAFGATVINLNTSIAASNSMAASRRASRNRRAADDEPRRAEEPKWRPRLAYTPVDQPIPEDHLIGDIVNHNRPDEPAIMRTVHKDDYARGDKEGWVVPRLITERLNKGQFAAVPNSARSMLGGPK